MVIADFLLLAHFSTILAWQIASYVTVGKQLVIVCATFRWSKQGV